MKHDYSWRRVFRTKSATLFYATIAVFVFFTLMKSTYLSGNNLRSMMNAMSLSGMLSIGIAILLISGEIDLASGSEAMLGGIVCALCLSAGLPIPVSVIVALLFGAVAGLINSFLINVVHLMGFIVTIGMSSIYTGIGYFITNAKGVNISGPFLKLGTTALFNVIPTPFIITVALIVIYAFILKYTDIGRKLYMVGGNRAAARLTGIDPRKITTVAFVNNGVIASLAGMCLAARMHVAKPSAAASGALDAIAASVLGGISFAGGVGGMGGCLIGLILLNAFINGLTGLSLPTYYQLIAQGVLLVVALSIDYFSEQARQRALSAADESAASA